MKRKQTDAARRHEGNGHPPDAIARPRLLP